MYEDFRTNESDGDCRTSLERADDAAAAGTVFLICFHSVRTVSPLRTTSHSPCRVTVFDS